MSQYVITISRQFASMGRSIAECLAKKLEINYYDRDIVEATAERMNKRISTISDHEERAPMFYIRKNPFNMGIYNISDEIFHVQSEIIKDLAKEESCIIVGRCADYILKDHPNHLSIYIYAPYEKRLENCTEKLEMSKRDAIESIRTVDAERLYYQRKYCPGVKHVMDHKHIMIDSSKFGIEGTAELLAQMIREQFK